jgi:hypothetical protein
VDPSDLWHEPVTVTLLDTADGDTVEVSGVSPCQWCEGNYSCDCNRVGYFEARHGVDYLLGEDRGTCVGCTRFLVVRVHAPGFVPAEFNEGYPAELVARHCPPPREEPC